MKHLSLILVLMLLPALMLAQEKNIINFPFDKVTGKWKMLTRKGLMVEEWERQDSTILTGKNYLFKGGDTILLTMLRLQVVEGKLVYTSLSKNQNEGKTISFALTVSKNNTYTFENQSNGFPEKIQYGFTGTDLLRKWIDDSDFNYTRVKN